MAVYFNEIEPAAAHILECLMKDGVIADGVVDRRSITEVQPDEIREFTQCHFFAGGGLWSVALRNAGWDDSRSIWTGSCPCQPFSAAGKRSGKDDERHLWPDFFRLISACRPPFVLGEQVAGQAGYDWFDGVGADLEGSGYAARAVDFPACALDAPHLRQRLYWLARDMGYTDSAGRREHSRGVTVRQEDAAAQHTGSHRLADAGGKRQSGIWQPECAGIESPCGGEPVGCGEDGIIDGPDTVADANSAERRTLDAGGFNDNRDDAGREEATGGYQFHRPPVSFWGDAEWISAADGKQRRIKPGIRLLVDGYPGRVALLRIAGNAIVPPAAQVCVEALMESEADFFCVDRLP
jgi:DNA (cytosine-5)-methyltransferase 1